MTSVEPLSILKSPPIAKEEEDETDTVTKAKQQNIVITETNKHTSQKRITTPDTVLKIEKPLEGDGRVLKFQVPLGARYSEVCRKGIDRVCER